VRADLIGWPTVAMEDFVCCLGIGPFRSLALSRYCCLSNNGDLSGSSAARRISRKDQKLTGCRGGQRDSPLVPTHEATANLLMLRPLQATNSVDIRSLAGVAATDIPQATVAGTSWQLVRSQGGDARSPHLTTVRNTRLHSAPMARSRPASIAIAAAARGSLEGPVY